MSIDSVSAKNKKTMSFFLSHQHPMFSHFQTHNSQSTMPSQYHIFTFVTIQMHAPCFQMEGHMTTESNDIKRKFKDKNTARRQHDQPIAVFAFNGGGET